MGTSMRGRIAVIGSRDFSDRKLLARVMDEYRLEMTLLISGGAQGADRLGEAWARKNEIPTQIYYPDHKRYKHAFHHRNRLIVEACDGLVAFWNGHSSGTKYTIDYARRLGRPMRIVKP